MKLGCRNCGETFFKDVKNEAELRKTKCPRCKSQLLKPLGPGLKEKKMGVDAEEKIREIVKSLSSGGKWVSHENVVSKASEQGIKMEKVEESIKSLKIEGKIIESKPGSREYKVIEVESFEL